MEELIDDFIVETREMLEALSGEIVAWEAAPEDRARLDAIFRFVHTVKGNCGFFHLPRLEALSHAAEDVLADVRAGKREAYPALVSAVLAVIDRIGELVRAIESGESLSSADDSFLIQRLRDVGQRPRSLGERDSGGVKGHSQPTRSIRLPVDQLDQLMSGVSSVVWARDELAGLLGEASGDAAVKAAFERLSASIDGMRDAMRRTRAQRIDSLFAPLPRMVRDLSAELGKRVVLHLDGGDLEADRGCIEMIRDPLRHIIRNAIDHGIEPPDERLRAGKSPVGLLRIAASRSGKDIVIEVRDDGGGVDGDELVRQAVAARIIDEEQAGRLSQTEKVRLMLGPGVSTACEVTTISGRGVGMDVVAANIEAIGGVIELENKPGQGLRLTLRVPLALENSGAALSP